MEIGFADNSFVKDHPNKYLILCIDACNAGLGGVLTQEGHTIAYESRKLKVHEKNYATYEVIP